MGSATPLHPQALEQQISAFVQTIFCFVIDARVRALRAASSDGQSIPLPPIREAVVLVHPKAKGQRCCAGPGCVRLALQRRRSGESGWIWWCVSCDPGRAPRSGAPRSGEAEVAHV